MVETKTPRSDKAWKLRGSLVDAVNAGITGDFNAFESRLAASIGGALGRVEDTNLMSSLLLAYTTPVKGVLKDREKLGLELYGKLDEAIGNLKALEVDYLRRAVKSEEKELAELGVKPDSEAVDNAREASLVNAFAKYKNAAA